MATTTQLVQAMVSSSGQLLTESMPLFQLSLGLFFALVGMFFVLSIPRIFKRLV